MAHDSTVSRRLSELREHDVLGMYAGDEPATGLDEAGRVSVTVDPTDRVTEVRILADAPELRQPEGLRDAVDQAARAARLARIDALRPPRVRGRARPQAARAEDQPVVAVQNRMGTGWAPDPASLVRHHYDTEDLGPATGVSDNDCVTVTVGIASSSGVVTADPGWLANARVSAVEQAITQAYDEAYRKRDER